MPTVVPITTTPTSRRAAMKIGAAALAASLTVPARACTADSTTLPTLALAAPGDVPAAAPTRATPIGALNSRLKILVDQRNVIDRAILASLDGPDCDALRAAFDENLEQCLAIHDEITTLPAENLEDAAIQATAAYYRAACLDCAGLDEDECVELGRDLHMLLASILVAVTKAADVDIDGLGWGEMRRLCNLWPAGRNGRGLPSAVA